MSTSWLVRSMGMLAVLFALGGSYACGFYMGYLDGWNQAHLGSNTKHLQERLDSFQRAAPNGRELNASQSQPLTNGY